MATERIPFTIRVLPETRDALRHAAIDQGMKPGVLVDRLTAEFLNKLGDDKSAV